MFVVLQTLNALGALNGEPLILKPVASTFNLSHVPAANITVSHKPAEPTIEPMIKLLEPVVTAHPALHPKNVLLLPVVFNRPAQRPAKKLSPPNVLQ
jgi:hypothetical protein